jgi:pyruvate dehydrogenase E1 component
MTDELRDSIIAGGYWLVEPREGADFAIVCCGTVATEAVQAYESIRDEVPGMGLAVVTSADRLHAQWTESVSPSSRGERGPQVEKLLAPLSPDAQLVTVIDGHPLALSWLGSVRRHRVHPLGVTGFGQSGDILDLYREYRIDADAIIGAVARACLDSAGWQKRTGHGN